MSENCEELKEEVHKHKDKSLCLFKEAEKLHQQALKVPFPKRDEASKIAEYKQEEAVKEIRVTAEIQKQLIDEGCEET